jgi:hypothetical protein
MCNLMNNSIRGLLASSLLLLAASAASAWADDARADATVTSTSDAGSGSSLSTVDLPERESIREDAEEDRGKPAPPVIIECPEGRVAERAVAKSVATVSDNAGNVLSSQPRDLEQADRVWTLIRGGEMHHIQLVLGGYTILALEDYMGATLDILVYDQNWNELASFGSDGCGAEFFLRPQVINIVILNGHKSDNAYKLYVVQ